MARTLPFRVRRLKIQAVRCRRRGSEFLRPEVGRREHEETLCQTIPLTVYTGDDAILLLFSGFCVPSHPPARQMFLPAHSRPVSATQLANETPSCETYRLFPSSFTGITAFPVLAISLMHVRFSFPNQFPPYNICPAASYSAEKSR